MPVTLITVIGNQVLLLLITATVSCYFVVTSRQLLLYISCTSLSLQKLTCSTNYEYTIGDYPQALNGAIASLRHHSPGPLGYKFCRPLALKSNYYIKFNNMIMIIIALDEPDIDEGSFVPRPSVITSGNKRIKIGTPVYVHGGFDVIIDCNIVNGILPITITWFRNGSLDLTRGNFSNITITDARNGEVFECRADNIFGFDTENTTIHVVHGKYV